VQSANGTKRIQDNGGRENRPEQATAPNFIHSGDLLKTPLARFPFVRADTTNGWLIGAA
jgi:hypothetical protein